MELHPFNIHSDFQDSLAETVDNYNPSEEGEVEEGGGNEFLDECLGDTF